MSSPARKQMPRRAKSPSAPAYSLQVCLEDAQRVFRAEKQAATSREAIAEYSGAAVKSGPFNRKLSSLRQYGLLEAVGKDLRVSNLFIQIGTAVSSTERSRALRAALAHPLIFQRLLSECEQTGFPSRASLTRTLIATHHFTKRNAEVVSRAFLDSVSFVDLTTPSRGTSGSQSLSGLLASVSDATDRRSPLAGFQQSVSGPWTPIPYRQEIPLRAGRRVVVELPHDVTAGEIRRVVRILQVLAKPIS